LACRNWISWLQLLESANAPWTSTTVGLAADVPAADVPAWAAPAWAVLARAAPLPARTAAAISGAAKARVSFFMVRCPFEVREGRGLRPGGWRSPGCPHHHQAGRWAANADLRPVDAGTA
jgi:hypothetical protein